ncbi:preprotein translocase subunit SecE [bacterium]|nr:preprotein translocase subunit SecE [candidate division CSSED10-310 bacterium]
MKNAQDNSKLKQKTIKHTKPKTKKKSGGVFSNWFKFLSEVKTEMKKVTWPPRREIISSTSALIVATVLIGLFLGVVDVVLANGVQPALAGNAGIMTLITVALFVFIFIWVYRSN